MNVNEIETVIDFYFSILGITHKPVKEHSERVAVMARYVANKTGKDVNAAYYAGIFHDIGKLSLPYTLFDGHNISNEEYTLVKNHVEYGYNILSNKMMFTSLCVGLHHNMSKTTGYGIDFSMFPSDLSNQTVKKILDISTIISICDFVDAFTTRKTIAKDGASTKSLNENLIERFPEEKQIIEIISEFLEENKLTTP